MGWEGVDRGRDGWVASLTQWTWVCVNSGSWWWTGRPGVLWFMGSPRVKQDWVTELNWTEPGSIFFHLRGLNIHKCFIDCQKWQSVIFFFFGLVLTVCFSLKAVSFWGRATRLQSSMILSLLPPWTYKKYIYMWSKFLWKQTGDWQEDSLTTKAVNKDPHGVVQEGRRSNQVGTCSPRRSYRGIIVVMARS